MRTPSLQIPDPLDEQPAPLSERKYQCDPRIVVIQGVNYYINWYEMKTGHSVFLKTIALPSTVMQALRPVERRLNIKLAAAPRKEFGRYGVRVWRIA